MLIAELFHEGIVLLPVFLQLLHGQSGLSEQFLGDIVIDCEEEGAGVVSELYIGVVLETDHIALAFEALGRIDIDFLLAEVAILEEHLLIVDAC